MKNRVLLAWELGAGYGHWANYQPLAERLIAAGSTVYAALSDVSVVPAAWRARYPLKILQAPTQDIPRNWRVLPRRSFADILYNTGCGDVGLLQAKTLAWRELFNLVKPELIVFEHCPTGLLASQGLDVRRIVIGTGFCSPPDVSPLTDLQPWLRNDSLRIRQVEMDVLKAQNKVLEFLGQPKIERITQLYYQVDENFLLGIRELDHYRRDAETKYWGVWSMGGGEPPAWHPDHGRTKVFAYLKPSSSLASLLECLSCECVDAIVYVQGLRGPLQTSFSQESIRFLDAPANLSQVADTCDLAILNGSSGTTTQFLLAGKPTLSLPIYLEQMILALRVQDLGAGICASSESSEEFRSCLQELLNSETYAQAARSVAARYEEFCPKGLVEEIFDRVNTLLT